MNTTGLRPGFLCFHPFKHASDTLECRKARRNRDVIDARVDGENPKEHSRQATNNHFQKHSNMKEIKSIVSGVTVVGKIDEYIFYNRLGVPCVRRAPRKKRDPDSFSPAQQVGQARLRYLVSLYQALAPTSVLQAWSKAKKRPGQTRFNAFVSRNYAAFCKDEAIADYARVKMSEGDLRLPLGIAATVSGTREITLTWDTEKDRIMGKTDDRLHVLLMAGDGSFRTVARDNLTELRGDGQAVVRLTPEEGLPEHLYCFWESANGQNFSPSKHIHIIWE